eukprot:GHVR01157279.1.p1 GENE.GHVR01157279.1~~GHVR01157279.1.p1  ORF type:complete len:173 (-),score=52.27 GHVR01157279.1:198-716(-)
MYHDSFIRVCDIDDKDIYKLMYRATNYLLDLNVRLPPEMKCSNVSQNRPTDTHTDTHTHTSIITHSIQSIYECTDKLKKISTDTDSDISDALVKGNCALSLYALLVDMAATRPLLWFELMSQWKEKGMLMRYDVGRDVLIRALTGRSMMTDTTNQERERARGVISCIRNISK